jgi:hypothetical protein
MRFVHAEIMNKILHNITGTFLQYGDQQYTPTPT